MDKTEDWEEVDVYEGINAHTWFIKAMGLLLTPEKKKLYTNKQGRNEFEEAFIQVDDRF